jgi:hypothetical protein
MGKRASILRNTKQSSSEDGVIKMDITDIIENDKSIIPEAKKALYSAVECIKLATPALTKKLRRQHERYAMTNHGPYGFEEPPKVSADRVRDELIGLLNKVTSAYLAQKK